MHTLLFIRYHPHLMSAFNFHLMTILETHYCFPSTLSSSATTPQNNNSTHPGNPMLIRPCPISPKHTHNKKKLVNYCPTALSNIISSLVLPLCLPDPPISTRACLDKLGSLMFLGFLHIGPSCCSFSLFSIFPLLLFRHLFKRNKKHKEL